ncbi:MAG: hypothetical protein IPJ40_12040 [Saprospirales bacterium]|nr:hypothetical protein [Saprospirales bacterium]
MILVQPFALTGLRDCIFLTYFDDADQDEEVVLLKEEVSWEVVKKLY